jgi:hypothetical protein
MLESDDLLNLPLTALNSLWAAGTYSRRRAQRVLSVITTSTATGQFFIRAPVGSKSGRC